LSQHHRFSVAAVLVLLISALYDVAPANATPRISATPASFTLHEGSSATTTIALTEPIICLGSPCHVSLTFSSSDPSLVTFSPSTLTWLSTDWAQTRTLSISALADQTYKGNQSIFVSATVVSASEFYSGFGLSISVSTIEIDRSPAEIAAEAARVAAANAEAARVAAANAEAAKKAKEQKELLEILGVIPSLAGISVNVGDLANSLLTTKCVKGKTTKFVKKGAKCPKGYVRKK
jgi:hypothetical protein